MHEQAAHSNNTMQVSEPLLSMDEFLALVERKAYRTALLTTRRVPDALDIVQDAMLKLFQHYHGKSPHEWPLLFQRILQHRIMDWHRQQAKTRKWFWQFSVSEDEDAEDTINLVVDEREQDPAELLARAGDMSIVLGALENLSLRQRQAFILRAWEGFDVKETAVAMECSEGSVKTHYSRAVHVLRELLLDNQ